MLGGDVMRTRQGRLRCAVAGTLALFALAQAGCGAITPMDIPSLLLLRKLNRVQYSYRLTMQQAVERVTQAIGDRGGYIRYGTIQGGSRTLYAKSAEDETITIYLTTRKDNPALINISINYGLVGDPAIAEYFFRALRATPVE